MFLIVFLSLRAALVMAGSPVLSSAPSHGPMHPPLLLYRFHSRGGPSATAYPRLCKWATTTLPHLPGRSLRLPRPAKCQRCRPPWLLAGRLRRRTGCVEAQTKGRGELAHPHPDIACIPSKRLLQGGWTACFWASYNGHLEALRALLEAGANPATPDKVREGRGSGSPLRCAGPWRHDSGSRGVT